VSPVSRVRLALSALALTACAETQAPDGPQAPAIGAPISSSLPVLQSARTETESGGITRPFNVTFRFLTPVTDRQERLFRRSARRWQEIIVKDVPAITGTIPRNFCGDFGTPRFEGRIDDILIDIQLRPIDGPGNILGFAGPCAVRVVDDLPAYGLMVFDTEDQDFLQSLDLLDEVIIHEMGHVLGYGTMWEFNRALLINVEARNPRFIGPAAVREWHKLGGRGRVPVEGQFGPATRLLHWDEKTFDNELMTGFLNLGENPLSNVSALSMRDIGYTAVATGDPYQLPVANEVTARSLLSGLDLRDGERLIQPSGAIE
jgi:hypothetical protein